MDYSDIIDLPHPEPQHRKRMPLEKRAAQFMPFAALTGFDEMLKKTVEEEQQSFNPAPGEPIDYIEEDYGFF